MTTILSLHAEEEGTYGIVLTFYDENGDSVVPDTLKWHLTDKRGATINARQDVAIGAPAATNTVALSGDDLAIIEAASSQETRYFTLEGTYTWDLGAGLPLLAECEFVVDSLKKIPS